MPTRRDFLHILGGIGAWTTLPGSAVASPQPALRSAQVVVVGGGYGGATVARYLRQWSGGAVRVTLVEKQARYVSCPLSNLVLSGDRGMTSITLGYEVLRSRWGVDVVIDTVTRLDIDKRRVHLATSDSLGYDRLILSPGIDFLPDDIEGLAGHEDEVPHAWKAGVQTQLLRRQLEAMPDGGVFVLHVPGVPFRCPPGPYERACLVARYLQRHKPRSKVLLLDRNPEIQSKKALFEQAFATHYAGLIEYRPDSELIAVDAATRSAELAFDTVKADVLNVIPPMRAGRLVDQLGVRLVNGHWVEVDFHTLEVPGAPGIHVLGDAILPAQGMPKSGHMANQHAKLAAAAVLARLAERPPVATPVLMNTCYSFINEAEAAHVASVYQYDTASATFSMVPEAGGVSGGATALEAHYAHAWAAGIWADAGFSAPTGSPG